MSAAATARKSATRPAPRRAARAAAPRHATRSAPHAVPGRLVPVAVGRTAVAVGGIADSGLVLGLTRSRLWIGLLAGLLVGIVGLNVMALQFNATASKTAAISEELKRENSALRADIAGGLSNERLQRAAARLGLVFPEPDAILTLTPKPGDAAAAAERLRDSAITVGTAYVPVAPITPVPLAEPELAAAEPAEAAVATEEPVVAEEVPAPAEQTAAVPAATVPSASGGATAP